MLTLGRILFFLSIYFTLSILVKSKFVERLETTEDGRKKLTLYKTAEDGSIANAVCQSTVDSSFLQTGWDVVQVQTFSNGNTDEEQAECAGEVEALSISESIWYFYNNNVKSYCKGRKAACKKVKTFLKEHLDWLEDYVKNKTDTDIWYQASLFIAQVKGLHSGYSKAMEKQNQATKKISQEEFMIMNLQSDLDDVFDALDGDISAKVKGRTRCSALIKLLPGNKDLIVAHNTWTSYVQMNRALKFYNMPLKTNSKSDTVVPGAQIAFSGYPGVISSGDDFYLSSAGLVALETTIGNSNDSLWRYVLPTGQLFETVRSVIALRLADSGKSWSEIFSQYNSGTYNNQWMIVNYNNFTQGKKPKAGTLYVHEQIPGYVHYADQTKVLREQLYWPSYNTPFYEDIFNLSGNQQLVEEYGDWFTYDKTARAEIFRRDHSSVTDVDSMMTLMRYNNYENDEYSKCNCTPPYSAENAIASRSDLNPDDGVYPFEALGHRCHGAIDAKVVSSEYFQNMTFVAVSGPSTGTNLPEFNWKTSDYKNQPHLGQPDTFTNFTPIVTPWASWE